jgi:hypothetical protein
VNVAYNDKKIMSRIASIKELIRVSATVQIPGESLVDHFRIRKSEVFHDVHEFRLLLRQAWVKHFFFLDRTGSISSVVVRRINREMLRQRENLAVDRLVERL